MHSLEGVSDKPAELRLALSDAVGQCIRQSIITHEGLNLKAV